MSTHEDWEAAKEKRNRAAVRVTWAVAAGNSPTAKDLTDFATAESEMDRITAELDGDGSEASA